jgi:hypothetical protein
VGQDRLGPSYFFIPLVLGPLNRLVRWEVPLGYIALRSFLFLQEQIKRHHHHISRSARRDYDLQQKARPSDSERKGIQPST